MKNKTHSLPSLPALPASARAKSFAPCRCGCGGSTQSTFRPGHDARHKGIVLRVVRGLMTRDDVLAWGGPDVLASVDRSLSGKSDGLLHSLGILEEVEASREVIEEVIDEAAS